MPTSVPCSSSRPKVLALTVAVAVLLPLSLYYKSKASLMETEDSLMENLAPEEAAAAAAPGPPQKKAGNFNLQPAKAEVALSSAVLLKRIPSDREEALKSVMAVETRTRHVFVGVSVCVVRELVAS